MDNIYKDVIGKFFVSYLDEIIDYLKNEKIHIKDLIVNIVKPKIIRILANKNNCHFLKAEI